MKQRSQGAWVALGLSLGVHAALVGAAVPRALDPIDLPEPEFVELTMIDGSQEVSPDPAPAPVQSAPPSSTDAVNVAEPSPTVASAGRTVPRRVRTVTQDQTTSAPTIASVATVVTATGTSVLGPEPSEGAGAVLFPDGAAPGEGGDPTGLTAEEVARDAVLGEATDTLEPAVDRYARINDELETSLREAGQARPHVTTRPAPELTHRSDGSYHWQGPAFAATITRNGEVSFSDRTIEFIRPGPLGDPYLDAELAEDREHLADINDNPYVSPHVADALNRPAQTANVTFRVDIGDAIARARGEDPYYAERRWFMRETGTLRRRLQRRAHERRYQRADRRLRGRLIRLWEDDSRTAVARRAAVVAMWNRFDGSGAGTRARGVIEQFVRDYLPAGSEHAFPSGELQRAGAFRPYND